LARTVTRRLGALGSDAGDGWRQLTLQLADCGEVDQEDETPDCLADLGLTDRGRERALLRDLQQASQRAALHESKIRVIRRLTARIAEPLVIFTEYRDPLPGIPTAL